MSNQQEDGPKEKIPGEGEAIIIESPAEVSKREEEDRRKHDDQYKQRQIAFNRRLVILTAFLVATSVVSDFISGYQSQTARIAADAAQESATASNNAARLTGSAIIASKESAKNTLIEMQAQTAAQQTAADASKIAAAAALSQAANSEKALNTTIDNFHSEQRAWIGMLGVKNLKISAGQEAKFEVLFENTGKSPALNVEVDVTGKSIPSNAEMTFTYPTPSGIRSNMVVQPGMREMIPSAGGTIPTGEQIEAIKTGQAILYLYGKVSYNDVFNIPHHTTFCVIIQPDLSTGIDCEEYNYAD
jgi:hypothetical protein